MLNRYNLYKQEVNGAEGMFFYDDYDIIDYISTFSRLNRLISYEDLQIAGNQPGRKPF
jgi:hypothetical protein